MARTKRVPVKRESSSEFFNKQTASWEDANGKGEKSQVTSGIAASTNGPVLDHAKQQPEAGVVQLITAVAGIYASL
jgi:UDP-galactose transporter B1